MTKEKIDSLAERLMHLRDGWCLEVDPITNVKKIRINHTIDDIVTHVEDRYSVLSRGVEQFCTSDVRQAAEYAIRYGFGR